MEKLNFEKCKSDQWFYKRNKNGNISYVIVYVDDILIADNRGYMRKIYEALSKECEIKNLGRVSQY